MTHRRKEFTAAERARWLAELSQALDDAETLASTLGLRHLDNPYAAEFCARLAAAKAQLKGLRLGRPDEPPEDQSPKWSKYAIWPNQADAEDA